ncbi:MAG TPA: hypothetical protein PLW35_02665 [Verrucomicrobiota bacterium]|nr:hypothetical protein [Verrucomicrobiota bacterium]
MKLLRNPIFFVLLLVAAIAVAYSSLKPKSRPARSARPAAGAAANVATKATQAGKTNAVKATAVRPERPIDVAYIEKHAQEWMEAPARDPFFAYNLLKQPNRQATNPPVRLVLTAIWRQTGGIFAVINGTVCSEGDKVEGFRVERIEDDRVILENDEWREVVRFPGAAASELPEQEYPEQPESTPVDSGGPVATASRERGNGS